MIRSTKTTLKFANDSKKALLFDFLSEYRKVVGEFVDLLWSMEKVPILPPRLQIGQ